MKNDVFEKLLDKANSKEKDGVYSYEGYPYAVIEGRLRFVSDWGKLLEFAHGMLVQIGECEYYYGKDKIKRLYKKNKV